MRPFKVAGWFRQQPRHFHIEQGKVKIKYTLWYCDEIYTMQKAKQDSFIRETLNNSITFLAFFLPGIYMHQFLLVCLALIT